MRRPRFAVLLPLLLAGCQSNAPTPPPAPLTLAPPDPWILKCVDQRVETPALLWNGLIGLRLGRDCTSGDESMFMIDEYGATGEEKIRGVPSPLQEQPWDAGDRLTPSTTKGYHQDLDMRTGVITSVWSHDAATVTCVTVMHPTKRMIAQRWTVKGTDWGLKQGPVPEVLGPSKVKWAVERKKVDASTEEVSWSIGRSPQWLEMQKARGIAVKLKADWDKPEAPMSFDEVLAASKEIWARRWETDIEIDGPVADQQAVRSFLFYLRSSIHPDGQMSISPFALSNQQYNGHVFWDADIWVFPALAFVDPQAAKAIPNYRIARFEAAKKNMTEGKTWPEGPEQLGKRWWKDNQVPSQYPWESSVSGLETMTGPSRKEHHITGSVLWGLNQAFALGLLSPSGNATSQNLYTQARNFWSVRMNPHNVLVDEPLAPIYTVEDLMSPDENHIGNNDLYTNLLAQWTFDSTALTKGLQPNFRWLSTEERKKLNVATFKLPRDGKTFLTYDNDALRGYKQAAAILAIYPLQYPPAEKEARAMMDRFSDKVTKNGPAMSDSVDSIIWSRLGEKDKAYAAWQRSWKDFVKPPLLLFSEKRNKDVTYFTTGAGGSLQSVIYGFLGFRLDSKKEPGAVWSKKLNGESWLSIKPKLPPSWKSVKFKNFTVLGQRFTIGATSHGATVIQGD